MEKVFEVKKLILVRLFCDKCKSVEMQSSAPTLTLNPGGPRRFTYKCPVCKRTHTATNQYPMQSMQLQELIFDEKKELNSFNEAIYGSAEYPEHMPKQTSEQILEPTPEQTCQEEMKVGE